ncbi:MULTISPECIES: hypothetical protein [unclassified Streptomyces]|uniref:hypothetical protein n=1 Tax=unclassified Streptomyces TaxID=2593676 RepID=UPI0033A86772
MNEQESEPVASYADEPALWRRFARLLPSAEDAAEFQDCWDIGEQEAGLQFVLLPRLLERGVPIGETTRAELAVMAETWTMWDALGADIARCQGDPAQDASLRLVEFDGDRETPGPAGVQEPDGPLLVPWITCTHCGQVLARAHRREEWGGLSYLPESYVVFGPDRGTAPSTFAQDSAWDALTALRTACPGREDSSASEGR